MKLIIFLLLLFVALLVSLALGINNDQLVTVNYLLAKAEMSLSSLLAITLAIGFAFSSLIFSTLLVRHKVQKALLESKIKKLTQSQTDNA